MRFSCLSATLLASLLIYSAINPSSAQAQPGGVRPPAPRTTIGGTAAAGVALVDVSHVMDNWAYFKAEEEAFKKAMETLVAQKKEREGELRKLVEARDGFEKGSASFKQLDEEIATKAAQLELDLNRAQKAVLEEATAKKYSLYKELSQEIQRFAEANGIAFVMNYISKPVDPTVPKEVDMSMFRPVMYSNPGIDITKQILDQLNARRASGGTANRPGGSIKK